MKAAGDRRRLVQFWGTYPPATPRTAGGEINTSFDSPGHGESADIIFRFFPIRVGEQKKIIENCQILKKFLRFNDREGRALKPDGSLEAHHM